jgi:hypothetical protein
VHHAVRRSTTAGRLLSWAELVRHRMVERDLGDGESAAGSSERRLFIEQDDPAEPPSKEGRPCGARRTEWVVRTRREALVQLVPSQTRRGFSAALSLLVQLDSAARCAPRRCVCLQGGVAHRGAPLADCSLPAGSAHATRLAGAGRRRGPGYRCTGSDPTHAVAGAPRRCHTGRERAITCRRGEFARPQGRPVCQTEPNRSSP